MDQIRQQSPLLQDIAYAKLKDMIVGGEMKPGVFFSERQMADLLDMSTSPVRAALKRLSSEGFVTISSQRGVEVRMLTVQELNDLFEYRFALESFVVRQLCAQPNSRALKLIEDNLVEQLHSAEEHDIKRHANLDVSFHVLLSEAYGNQAILNALMLIKDRLNQVAACVTMENEGRSIDNYNEHKELFRLIQLGEQEQAVRVLAEHLEYARTFFFRNKPMLIV